VRCPAPREDPLRSGPPTWKATLPPRCPFPGPCGLQPRALLFRGCARLAPTPRDSCLRQAPDPPLVCGPLWCQVAEVEAREQVAASAAEAASQRLEEMTRQMQLQGPSSPGAVPSGDASSSSASRPQGRQGLRCREDAAQATGSVPWWDAFVFDSNRSGSADLVATKVPASSFALPSLTSSSPSLPSPLCVDACLGPAVGLCACLAPAGGLCACLGPAGGLCACLAPAGGLCACLALTEGLCACLALAGGFLPQWMRAILPAHKCKGLLLAAR